MFKNSIPMGLLCDHEIDHLCRYSDDLGQPMISPYESETVRDGKISYGLSSYGYDMRLGTHFHRAWESSFRFSNVVDPKKDDAHWSQFDAQEGNPFLIDPGQFLLGETVETWNIPPDIMVVVLNKSTYARTGLVVNVTPMEPGWKGVLTLEILNPTNHSIKLYPGEGIAQALFFRGRAPITTYASKQGKYQNQRGVTKARI